MGLLLEQIQFHINIMFNYIKIMPEFECSPIWVSNDGIYYHNLSLSKLERYLRDSFRLWDKLYQDTLNMEDPLKSCFKTDKDKYFFEVQGISLWRLLSEKYQSLSIVSYWSTYFEQEFFDIDLFEQRLKEVEQKNYK